MIQSIYTPSIRWLWSNINILSSTHHLFSTHLYRRKIIPIHVDKQLLQHNSINGVVQHVTHYNDSEQLIIMKIKPTNVSSIGLHDGTITVVGKCDIAPRMYEHVACIGTWKRHRIYGDQFKARYVTFVPGHQQYDIQLNEHQLITYLSNNIDNIGPKRAQLIVSHFGEDTLNILTNQIHRLHEVKGVPNKLVKQIATQLGEENELRDLYIMLHKYNIRGVLANKLVTLYGDGLPTLLQTNAYQLTEISGIGFATADRIALSFNVAVDSSERIQAAIWHALNESTQLHVYLPQHALLNDAVYFLKCPTYHPTTKQLLPALEQLVNKNMIVETILTTNTILQPISREHHTSIIHVPNPFNTTIVNGSGDIIEWNDIVETNDIESAKPIDDIVADIIGETTSNITTTSTSTTNPSPPVYYISQLYKMELGLADMIVQLLRHTPISSSEQRAMISKFIDASTAESSVTLSIEQQQAVEMAVFGSLSVLTGGPGCGKTFTVATIVACWNQMGYKCLLVAPTGRAASRLRELTNHPSSTIHRALQSQEVYHTNGRDAGRFTFNESNQLPYDAIVVDEMSMVDLPLMYALVSAIKLGTKLLLVGDTDQLPPLSAGDVLRDVIDSGLVPTTRLNKPFRQAIRSQIISNAHRINSGQMPLLESISPYNYTKPQSDCLFIDIDSVVDWPYKPRTILPSTSTTQSVTDNNVTSTAENLAVSSQIALAWIVERLLPSMNYVPYHDLQVLTPSKRGITGTNELNRTLGVLLNDKHKIYKKHVTNESDTDKLSAEYHNYTVNDRVLQIKNDYKKSRVELTDGKYKVIMRPVDNTTDDLHHVFNGEIGVVSDLQLNDDNKFIIVRFQEPTRYLIYRQSDQQTLIPAWAMTIHKSQGGEFPVLVLYMTNANCVMLYRRLLYTAITRAKKLCIVVGHKTAIHRAVNQLDSDRNISGRYSWLSQRLIDTYSKYTTVQSSLKLS